MRALYDIKLARMNADIAALSSIGMDLDSQTIARPMFSAAERQAREWYCRRLAAAGLDQHVDGVGNIWTACGANSSHKRTLVLAHLDTGADAGPLAGGLGAVTGLEVLRAGRELQLWPDRQVELIVYGDGAERFGDSFGLAALRGALTDGDLAARRDKHGNSLVDAGRAVGIDRYDIRNARRIDDTVDLIVSLDVEASNVTSTQDAALAYVCNDHASAPVVRELATRLDITLQVLENPAGDKLADFDGAHTSIEFCLHRAANTWPLDAQAWDQIAQAATLLLNTIAD